MPDNRLNLVILVANMVKEIRFCKFKRLVVWTKGNSVPERASWGTEWTRGTVEGLLVYATRFQSPSVQKTGAFGTEEIFGTKNPLLRYGIDTHFRRALHRK